MSRFAGILASITVGVATASCSAPSANDASLRAVQARLQELESQQRQLKASVASLSTDLETLRLRVGSADRVVMSVADKGYVLVDAGLGKLMVELVDIVPMADGQKVTVRIGNPYAAGLSGLRLDVDYGPGFAAHASIDAPETLAPASWTPVSFVVAPASPKDVGIIRVGVLALSSKLVATHD